MVITGTANRFSRADYLAEIVSRPNLFTSFRDGLLGQDRQTARPPMPTTSARPNTSALNSGGRPQVTNDGCDPSNADLCGEMRTVIGGCYRFRLHCKGTSIPANQGGGTCESRCPRPAAPQGPYSVAQPVYIPLPAFNPRRCSWRSPFITGGYFNNTSANACLGDESCMYSETAVEVIVPLPDGTTQVAQMRVCVLRPEYANR